MKLDLGAHLPLRSTILDRHMIRSVKGRINMFYAVVWLGATLVRSIGNGLQVRIKEAVCDEVSK